MNIEQQQSFQTLFEFIYKGEAQLIKLSFDLLQLAHTWDDLVDKDQELKATQIDDAFILALFDLPSNPFWGPDLQSNLLNVYLRWHDANLIEQDKTSSDNALTMAWMLRAGLYDLFVLLAAKRYGLAWARQVGIVVRKHYGETVKDFIAEVRNA